MTAYFQYLFAPEHVLQTLTFIIAIFTGILTYIKWSDALRAERIELVRKIVEQLRFDPELALTEYMIDYGIFHYAPDFHGSVLSSEKPNNSIEFRIDKLLSYIDFVCYLAKEKKIRADEFYFVEYKVVRICESLDVQQYLWNLYHYGRTRPIIGSFHYLIDYMLDHAELVGLDKAEFLNKDSKLYPKNLNF